MTLNIKDEYNLLMKTFMIKENEDETNSNN